jgi:predicted Rossmann-fold nucleotide-binding protein
MKKTTLLLFISSLSGLTWLLVILLVPVMAGNENDRAPSLSGDQTGRMRRLLLADLHRALEVLSMLPPSVAFLGGSRITATDPVALIAGKTGKLLAEQGIPVCTGGGAGIMEFVPAGFLEGIRTLTPPHLQVTKGFYWKAGAHDMRTQGFNLKLPCEQKPNPYLQASAEFRDISIRKFALTENKRAFAFFPGGFGTHDEFFEVWDLLNRNENSDPLALLCQDFWLPEIRSIELTAVNGRSLITPAQVSRIEACVTDEPTRFLSFITGWKGELCGFENDPATLEKLMTDDINRAAGAYSRWDEAVVIMGSAQLEAGDPAIAAASKVAAELAGKNIPLRLGNGGLMAEITIRSARERNGGCPVSAFLMEHEKSLHGAAWVTVKSVRIHKAFVSQKMRALIVLPGDVHTLSELFGVLCLMQTGIVEKKPVVLIGRDYWEPLFATYGTIMLSEKRKLIAPEDMELVTITDDPGEVVLRVVE